jgi:hypothetical protein
MGSSRLVWGLDHGVVWLQVLCGFWSVLAFGRLRLLVWAGIWTGLVWLTVQLLALSGFLSGLDFGLASLVVWLRSQTNPEKPDQTRC